jgi:DNA-binding IclR family transcriptional regulator
LSITKKSKPKRATKQATQIEKGEKQRKVRPVGAAMNVIRVLRHLAQSRRAEGATEIARATDMYPGTCYQLLRTLVQDDLLHFDAVSKKYSLSNGLSDLVATSDASAADGFPLKRREYIAALSRRFAATVYLIGCMQHDRGVLVDFAQSSQQAGHVLISSLETIYQGAMGRVATYIGHPSRTDWKKIFEAMPWQVRPTFESWSMEVEAVSKSGYGVDRGARSRGITVVSAPICDSLGRPVFYLAVLLFDADLSEDRIAEVGAAAKRCAEEVRHEAAIKSLIQ